MKPNLSEDIIPVSEFKKNAASYLQDIRVRNRSVILTQNGHSAAIVVSPEVFEKMQYERDLFAAIAKGEQEIEEGKSFSHEEVFQTLYSRLK